MAPAYSISPTRNTGEIRPTAPQRQCEVAP